MKVLAVIGIVVVSLAILAAVVRVLGRRSVPGQLAHDVPLSGHRATPVVTRPGDAPAEPGAEDQFPVAGDAAPGPPHTDAPV